MIMLLLDQIKADINVSKISFHHVKHIIQLITFNKFFNGY